MGRQELRPPSPEGLLPAELWCPPCFHTLCREKASYKGIYFPPNTPPVNNTSQSSTFKLEIPTSSFAGAGRYLYVSGRTSDHQKFIGGWGQPETGQEMSVWLQNSTMVGRRGCVPASETPGFPLCWALWEPGSPSTCSSQKNTLGPVSFSSCSGRLHLSLHVSALASPLPLWVRPRGEVPGGWGGGGHRRGVE